MKNYLVWTMLAAMAIHGVAQEAPTHAFSAPGDWAPSRRDSFGADGVCAVRGNGELYATTDLIAINPEGKTVLTGEFKRLPDADDNAKFCFALITYDRYMRRLDGIHVNVRPGTATELAAACQPEDTVLKIRNGAKILPHHHIVFHVKDDLSDLPNRHVNRRAPVTCVKQVSDDVWEVTLKEAVGMAAAVGVKIRAHEDSPYLYAGAFMQPIPEDWTVVTGTIQGAAPGNHRNKWRPGTAFVQVGIWGFSSTKAPFLAFRNITLTVSGIDAGVPGQAVRIPERTWETRLRLSVSAEPKAIGLHFGDGTAQGVVLSVFDDRFREAGQASDTILPMAGIDVQPFNARYRMRPGEFSPGQKSTAARLAAWGEADAILGKPYTLAFRQTAIGIEAWLNGSYIGTLAAKAPLIAVSGDVTDTLVECRPGGQDASMAPIDLAGKGRPGAVWGGEAVLNLKPGAAAVLPPFPFVSSVGLDLGLTAQQTKNGDATVSLADTPSSFIFTVPAAQYSRAWVLFALDDASGKDACFNARLTRFNRIPGQKYVDRSYASLANTLVEDMSTAQVVGAVTIGGRERPLLLLEVPLASGDIQDIIFTDRRASHALRKGRYLDFELSGRPNQRRMPFGDTRHLPDPTKVSAVQVFGLTLEISPGEMEVRPVQVGNIFQPDETPELIVAVRPQRPGDYQLRWQIRSAEGQVVGDGKRDVPGDTASEHTLNLAQPELGWYEIVISLWSGTRQLLTHHASFALLGEDTRQAGLADSPYGSWWYGGAHYTPAKIEDVGPLFLRAGMRRAQGAYLSEVEMAPWKLGAPCVRLPRDLNATKEDIITSVQNSLKKYPSVRNAMIFHEHAPSVYQIAPELIGRKPRPEDAWPNADKRLAFALRVGQTLRENFPQLNITIGNSLASTELVAEVLRGGFPEEYADYVGLEVVGRDALPERQWEASLQAGDLMLQTVRAFGCQWGLNACFECNYRMDALIGADRQAEWYVRDLLLSQAWGFRDIFIGIMFDVGNSYANSFWGSTGLCTRAPYTYPKKSYVAVAFATKMLDQVVGRKAIPTGSESVYAQEFTRRDGDVVTALWTSRGTAVLTLTTNGAPLQVFDLYGRSAENRPNPPRREPGNRLTLTAGTATTYILSAAPSIQAIACGHRGYPDDQPPADAVMVKRLDNVDEWRLAGAAEPLLERTTGLYMPYRTRGDYALRQVQDDEQGTCLELELIRPDLSLPTVFWEYAALELRTPVELSGEPHSLGMFVKGNSGWGQVYWIIEDAAGQRRVSCGTRIHNADVFDYSGRVSLCFDGWNFVSLPITGQSSILDLSTGTVANLWEYGSVAADGTFKRGSDSLQWPLKLVGIGFAAQSRPLFLTERRPHRQIVRFSAVAAFDHAKPDLVKP